MRSNHPYSRNRTGCGIGPAAACVWMAVLTEPMSAARFQTRPDSQAPADDMTLRTRRSAAMMADWNCMICISASLA